MANYTENYDLVKPTMAETADIRTINGNMDTVDAIMHDTQVSMADAFDSTKSYAIREKCMYEFKLYQCIHPHTGPWNADNWVRVNAAETGGNYVEITPTYQSGLKIAETNIDGDQDEIDVPYFGGATAQENGTGGAVPAPTSSDVGKFLSSNGGWETPSGGGGGTTVVPNPVGEPTDELETVRIGDTIFSIPGSGGGSGKGYDLTLLWDSGSATAGAVYATDYTLLDNLSNYDQIILMVSTNGDRADANHQYTQQIILDVDYLLTTGSWHNVNVAGYGTRYFEAGFTDTAFRIIQGDGDGNYKPTIYQIYGIKFGGSGYREDTLYEYTDTALPNSITLSKDWNSYDAIVIDVSRSGDTHQNITFLTSNLSTGIDIVWTGYNGEYFIYDVTNGTTLTKGNSGGSDIKIASIKGVKYGGGSDSSEEISDMTWTELVSTTGTSTAVAIPQGTKKLVLTAQLGGIVTKVAEESIANIQKLLDVSLETTWNMGGEYADTAGNHTTVAMSVSNGQVVAKSGYSTVTAKVYALS